MLQDKFLILKSNLELNSSLDTSIQTRHTAVRGALENIDSNIKSTKLIGSLQRKTRIQPIPGAELDIDILVVMGEFDRWLPPTDPYGLHPQKAMDNLHATVTASTRYGDMNPQQDSPTVSIKYADNIKVEFVPAWLDNIGHSSSGVSHTPIGRAYWIPKNGEWHLADYDYEAEYISQQNAATGGLLIPTIKMLKALKRIYFPQLGSFHMDIIATIVIPAAVNVRKQNNASVDYSHLIRDFFFHGQSYLSQPVKIPGSHSAPLSLTPTDSMSVLTKFQEIVKYIDAMKDSSETEQHRKWKELFKDPFPAV